MDDALQLWTALGVGSPDSFQRPQGPLAGASSFAVGVAENIRTSINVQLGRVDINWASSSPSGEEPPYLSDWKSVANEAKQATKKLLNSIDAIRVGVTINTSRRLVDGEDIIEELGKLHLNASFPDGAEDIIYQFNSPHSFAANETRMNRLHTWATGQQQMISFKINIGQPTTTPIVVRSVQVISFRIDVNSVNLEINQIKSVADKIIEELFEVAAGVISKYCVGVS